MLEELKERVCLANKELFARGLAQFTWGNASEIDREKGIVCIKPSGVPYDELTPRHMVLLDLNGNAVEGELNPSSDMPTHLALYRAFPGLGGMVHTHSRWATVWAQAGRDIPCYGTTHADTFLGKIPCTRPLTDEEIAGEYERETGNVIIERFHKLDPANMPAALVYGHGPFAWGKDASDAVYHAAVLEEVAMMAWHTEALPETSARHHISKALINRHFFRKHGEGATYGQPGGAPGSQAESGEEGK